MPSASEDHIEITAALDRYAEALDGRQWSLLADVFSETVEADYDGWRGSDLATLTAFIRSHLDPCGPTQHLFGNYRIAVTGDRAQSQVYVRAFHIGVGPHKGKTYEMGGEYTDHWERSEAGFRSVRRSLKVIFEQGSRSILGDPTSGVAKG